VQVTADIPVYPPPEFEHFGLNLRQIRPFTASNLRPKHDFHVLDLLPFKVKSVSNVAIDGGTFRSLLELNRTLSGTDRHTDPHVAFSTTVPTGH